jgi:uncharacterized protein with HEPN domain
MFSDRARQRLQDIIDNADWIASDLDGIDGARLRHDRMRADAVERCLHRITEAVIQLGAEQVAEAGLNVPWHEIRNLGNRLRHEYRRIDRQVIYDIAVNDVPALRNAAVRALNG